MRSSHSRSPNENHNLQNTMLSNTELQNKTKYSILKIKDNNSGSHSQLHLSETPLLLALS